MMIPQILADASTATAQGPSGLQQLVANFFPLIVIFFVMYLILIRPQQQKAKEHEAMVKRLKAGDSVITTGGVHGVIAGVKENTVDVRVADKVCIQFSRKAIVAVVSQSSDAE